VANPDEYTTLDELPDSLLTCKALWMHDWGKNPSPDIPRGMLARMASFIVCLRCKRCKRERYTFLDSKGRKLGAHQYRNPIGYPKTHRLDNDSLWGEMVNRSLLVSTYNGSDDG
jgi:hypothetical protein